MANNVARLRWLGFNSGLQRLQLPQLLFHQFLGRLFYFFIFPALSISSRIGYSTAKLELPTYWFFGAFNSPLGPVRV
jgi:hypothetical protein